MTWTWEQAVPGASDRRDIRVMVVDDEPTNVLLVCRLLEREGYGTVRGWTDPAAAVDDFVAFAPDLVVVDLHMPGLDGFEVLARIEPLVGRDDYLPVLVLTADVTTEARTRSFRSGARDFMTKPIDPTELSLRVRSLLDARSLNRRIDQARRAGSGGRMDPIPDLPDAPEVAALVTRLVAASAIVDDEPVALNERVSTLSAAIAAELGCDPSWVARIGDAARLHDVGKVAIPQALLLRSGAMTDEERHLVESHTVRGAELLGDYRAQPTMAMAAQIALGHHERLDGSGYPHGLVGDAIPLAARIVAVADAYVSAARLAADGSWAARAAVGKVRAGAGTAYDPAVVAALDAVLAALAPATRTA